MSRITPEYIGNLEDNEVFVFGSNLLGKHGGGAALMAYMKFGAIMNQGVGEQGQSYAIPTKANFKETLLINRIKVYVDNFILIAKISPEKRYYVTKIGCGRAGLKESDIAPLFKDAIDLENVYLPIEFIKIIKKL